MSWRVPRPPAIGSSTPTWRRFSIPPGARQTQGRRVEPSQHGGRAKSVASYLENRPADTLLAAFPFRAGFKPTDHGFPRRRTGRAAHYLLPGMSSKPSSGRKSPAHRGPRSTSSCPSWSGRPPLPNTCAISPIPGPHAPRDPGGAEVRLPRSQPFLMYGLTEAFARPFLPPKGRPPSRFDRQSHPNAEILVLREDGSPCAANEPGNWSTGAPWSAWVTGTIRRRPPNATNPFPPMRRAANRPGPARNRCFLRRHGTLR